MTTENMTTESMTTKNMTTKIVVIGIVHDETFEDIFESDQLTIKISPQGGDLMIIENNDRVIRIYAPGVWKIVEIGHPILR